jgi:hypothetical protein
MLPQKKKEKNLHLQIFFCYTVSQQSLMYWQMGNAQALPSDTEALLYCCTITLCNVRMYIN